MVFWRDMVFPIVVALLLLGGIVFVANLVLRFFRIDFPIIRLIVVVALWYYLGPIAYNFLLDNVINIRYELIEIIYSPIQSIISAFENFV